MDELEVGGDGGGGASGGVADRGGCLVEALNEKFLHADCSADSV